MEYSGLRIQNSTMQQYHVNRTYFLVIVWFIIKNAENIDD